MDTIVKELKSIMQFKETTGKGDIVLVACHEPQMLAYALVTDIEKDVHRKKDWWNVHMQLLTIPPQEIIWTLREPQFTGQEIFTMDGSPRFIQAIALDQHGKDSRDKKNTISSKEDPGKKNNPFHIVK